MTVPLYPLTLQPVYKNYIWGGDRIIHYYHRNAPPGVYAESWEVSDRPEGTSQVASGPLEGTSISELIQTYGDALVGTPRAGNSFPLLIKLIDARETLSVQVHPDNTTAAQVGGEAKTEMWYVLAADPDAFVYAGWKPDVDVAAFRQAQESNTIESILNKVPVAAEDAIFMPGGRVHAIGSGCLLLEVQQNSNTTFRVHDWGRVDADGHSRELHVEQALQVMRWQDDLPIKAAQRRLGSLGDNELWEAIKCPYFRMDRLIVRETWPAGQDGRSFHYLFPTDAPLGIQWANGSIQVGRGVSVLIPAGLGGYTLHPFDGPCTVLRTTQG